MTTIELDIPNIPKGEEKSFRRGVADGLLNDSVHKEDAVHDAAYRGGFAVGESFKKKIAVLYK
jgi:hypothetical protein